jgi:hypothetical protein
MSLILSFGDGKIGNRKTAGADGRPAVSHFVDGSNEAQTNVFARWYYPRRTGTARLNEFQLPGRHPAKRFRSAGISGRTILRDRMTEPADLWRGLARPAAQTFVIEHDVSPSDSVTQQNTHKKPIVSTRRSTDFVVASKSIDFVVTSNKRFSRN